MDGPRDLSNGIRVTFTRHEFAASAAPREMTQWERQLVERFASHDGSIGLEGLRQAQSLRVVEECLGCPTVLVEPTGTARARIMSTLHPGRGRYGSVGDDALASDSDGVPIFAVLHVRDGLIAELEVGRMDGEPIKTLPAPEDFRLGGEQELRHT